ncbi:S8 family serine peptidase [Alteromonas ponticola]|uniref:S8 family serine peptidase n=1 Tax=Alteromonas aquimaris TaxID=2998417 RepID=A0ABT3PA97_9ALTE|nr:S8 family serine peptidase [Alteromonas aquimaris]MCW8109707.1 S8 family serine peptidase [Alteromonas aquimaris]
MKKFTLSAVAAAFIAAPASHALAEAYIGEQLATQLTTLSNVESVMAVVTFDQLEPLAESQIQQILNLGIVEGVQFRSLPIIGVMATKAQIEALAKLENVRSIFANRKMEYYNADAREITGVDEVQGNDFVQRNGVEFTGKGVTIMVNDSGVDASHQDLLFGDTVVENVQALTHASAISLTGVTDGLTVKGQINTDLNSGHGTHCAGTIAGSGVMSEGKYVGAAPDADLIGYGSGGGLFLLDTIGGFDFAINNLYTYENPIKIISNSWGTSGKYEPLGPVSLATYKAHKLGIISVFAAGNDGPGEDSHNPYAQIPWGMSVGAGDKFGKLADFSSRGLQSESGDFTMPDGTEWTYHNEVSIVAPGVDIISTRASSNLVANGGDADLDAIETEYVPFYTMISGTSMATPHVAGIIALMLEANPNLDPLTIKKLLQETATNMPGYQRWEVGAGYVNARSAVAAALDYDMDYRTTVNNLPDKTFKANALVSTSERTENFEIFYSPVGEPEVSYFEVGDTEVLVKASASSPANLTKLVLVAPDGTEYFGNLTTPVLSETMRVSAPAIPGTWGIYVYGLTSLSGVSADPLGVTNGPGLPETFDVTVSFEESGGFKGIDDIEGHPHQGVIEFAISERLMDGSSNRKFHPDWALHRMHFARYAVMGGAVRQYRDLLNESAPLHEDTPGDSQPYFEAVMAMGGALKDATASQNPVMLERNGNLAPYGRVKKVEMAYSLVQLLGMQALAEAFDPKDDIIVEYKGQQIVLSDQDDIPIEMKGYVQAAITLSLLNVEFSIDQGSFALEPTLTASFSPDTKISRAHYAVIVSRLFTQYFE